jgi:hypothetical protein
VSHAALVFFIIILVNATYSTAQAQKSATSQTVQSRGNDVDRAYLRKYQQISALDVSERRELFVQASAAEKSGLWRIHLALTVAKRPELNREQRELILDAISLATPELFAISAENPIWKTKVDEPLQLLRQRALRAYSKQEAANIFANIGNDEIEKTILDAYLAISTLSLAERKELFAKANSKVKSDLWRVHLALYLVNRADLNHEQREVILDAMLLATPELFSLSPSDPQWKTQVDKPLQLVSERARAVFSKSEGAELFTMLGGLL